jgi:cytochrome c oxidase cbb3-type subunit 4
MDTYEALRHFADSWVLLGLTLVFLAVVFWAFRPGGRKSQDEAATSIFRNEDRPARDGAKSGTSGKEGTK